MAFFLFSVSFQQQSRVTLQNLKGSLSMDTKVLVGGVVGVGLIAIAGIFILTSDPDGTSLQNTAANSQDVIDINPGASAYDLPVEEPDFDESIENEPRDLQASRRNGQGGREGRGNRFEDFEARMMQFDTDGDGMLNEAERDALANSFRQRMIDRFDTDGDGIVSIEEQFAARRDSLLNSRRGQRMRDEFDADGDGTLNEEELAAMNAEIASREADRMAEIVSQYDLNGDGEMSLEETVAMQDQQFQERRQQMDQFTSQFDEDGDGNLNADERVDARDTMIERRELERFLRRYDTNGDGEIGTSDYDRFTDAYGKKEPYADVNRDGIYNMDDVVMFRDMTEHVNGDED
jgi:Ca2+-binding EF-hand superfamily protein